MLDWSRLCAQLGCARLCSAVLNWIVFLLGPAGLGVRLGSARIGCARLGFVALGSAELASCSFWLALPVVAAVMVSYVFNCFSGFRCLKVSETFVFHRVFISSIKNAVFGPPPGAEK